MTTNRYPGKCVVCSQPCAAGDGKLTSDGLKHLTCLYGRRRTMFENIRRNEGREYNERSSASGNVLSKTNTAKQEGTE
jgi:hypothetical protein